MAKEKDTNPVWRFRLTEKIAQYKQVSLVENIDFWQSQSKYWFYGYKTHKELKAEIWGKKVNLALLIAPENTPREALPLALKHSEEGRQALLSPEQKEQIVQLESRIKTLKEMLPSPPDEELERQYWTLLDPQKFTTAYLKAAAIWNSPDLEEETKSHQASQFLMDIYKQLKEIEFPDELMRDDTQFSIVLTKVTEFALTIENNAKRNKTPLPPGLNDLIELTNRLLNRMIEGGNKLFGKEREMTPKEKKAYEALCTQLNKSKKTLEERLKIVEQIGKDPLVDSEEKIELLERAIGWIKKSAPVRTPSIPCPDAELIKKHLNAIGLYLQEFEAEGKEVWQLKIAEALLDSARIWREDFEMTALTLEEFASIIELESAEIKTSESEKGGINIHMQLYFQDKEDSFDGHSMCAIVENHTVKEITLMG